MSRALGQVRFADGAVFHYIYEGTGDTVVPKLYSSSKEAWAAWAGDIDEMYIRCECAGESVVIANDYGDGSFWAGRACREHLNISDGPWISPYDETDGHPDWWQEPKED